METIVAMQQRMQRAMEEVAALAEIGGERPLLQCEARQAHKAALLLIEMSERLEVIWAQLPLLER